MRHLAVWKGEQLVGQLWKSRSGLRFAYDPPILERVGLGRPIVSLSLPTAVRTYPNSRSYPFFDGLLPEGEARRIIAYDFGLPESDTFALLERLGRDCAGALAVLPAENVQHRHTPHWNSTQLTVRR